MIDKIINIAFISILIFVLTYPLIRIISKAWYKGYFEEISNIKFKDLNKRSKK